MNEPRVGFLLLGYALCSFTYAKLCGLAGGAHHPLGAFQVYALAIPLWYALGCFVYRLRAPLPRMWPPTRAELLSAAASTLVLTSETLALLMPSSLVAVVAGKGGCLLFPDPLDRRPLRQRLALSAAVFAAVLLAALHKPLRWLPIPLLLACTYVLGQRLKLRAVRMAKGDRGLKPGFFGAGQVAVMGLTLCLAAAGSFAPAAPLADWRLWLVALASMGCGLFGLRLVLHGTRESVVYPAYRGASLLCALAASKGPLGWSGWLAFSIALCAVLEASCGLRRIGRWLALGALVVAAEFEAARRELAN